MEKWVEGEIHAVPCPWCNRRNDLRGIQEWLFNGMTGEPMAKQDLTYSCDGCKGRVEVTRIQRTIVVSVRKA